LSPACELTVAFFVLAAAKIWAGGEYIYLQACLEFFKNIFVDGHRVMDLYTDVQI
jgi:hypothetical protein